MANKPVSASHLAVWKTCKRKERFIYGLGLREPAGAAATAGKKVHALLEEWIKDDLKPPPELLWDNYDLGRMAWALSYKMPPKELITASEETFNVTLHGIDFTGVIDLQTADEIWDFKTTSKARYIKSNEQLEVDPQRLLYLAAKPAARSTTWLYGSWEDYGTAKRTLAGGDTDVRESFKIHVLTPAEEILLVEGVDPLSLPAPEDRNVCRMYPPHGCPFKSKCFPVNKTAAKMSKLLDKLNKKPSEPTQVMPLEKVDLINGPPVENKVVTPAPRDGSENDPEFDDLKPIDMLFIECFPLDLPIGERVIPAHELIVPSAKTVAADQQVFHPLLVDYSKGGPMLAVQLAADLKGKRLKYVYLETKSAEGRAVMHALMNMSKFVVKGMI